MTTKPPELIQGPKVDGSTITLTPTLELGDDSNELRVGLGQAVQLGRFTIGLLASAQFNVAALELRELPARRTWAETEGDAIAHTFVVDGFSRAYEPKPLRADWFWRCWIASAVSPITITLRLSNLGIVSEDPAFVPVNRVIVETIPTLEVTL